MGKLSKNLAFLGIAVFIWGCHGPLLQSGFFGEPSAQVSFSFRSLFSTGDAGGRFILPEMADGSLTVTVERLDQKKQIFRQTFTMVPGTGGWLEARTQVKVPINVELRILASFTTKEGVEVSRVERTLSASQTPAATGVPVYLLPTASFPGLLTLDSGGSLGENLIVDDGKSKVVALGVEPESAGKPRKVQWTGGTQAGDIQVVVKDSEGRPVEFTGLNGDLAQGLVFIPTTGGIYYIIVFNQPPAEGTSPAVPVDLGRPSVPVSLTYDGNGASAGTVPASRPAVFSGDTFVLPGAGDLVRGGYLFTGWSPTADGSGGLYASGASFTVGKVDVVLYAQWRNADEVPGTLKVGFTLSQPVYQVINFESKSVTIPRTGSVDLAALDPVMAAIPSGWAWYVNGTKQINQSASSYKFQGDIHGVGDHIVTVTITLEGVAYSGDLKITVTPAAEEGVYTVTYSSQGADGGSAPVDLNLYMSGDPVALWGSNLTKGSYRFLGWKTSPEGSGVVHYPGESLPMPEGDLTLYPVWEDMVAVPGGTFQRNDDPADLSAVSSFLMGRFTVTNAQWYAVMGGSAPAGGTENLPKTTITWLQAVQYCNALSLREGLEPAYADPASATTPVDLTKNGYRLPTQMEYLWAAMGGLSDSRNGNVVAGINRYGYSKSFAGYNGSNVLTDYAWTNQNAPEGPRKVGTKHPNELFLHDMSGNVYQWNNDTPGPLSGLLINAHPSGSSAKYWMGGSQQNTDATKFRINNPYSVTPELNYSLGNGAPGFRVVRNAPSVAWVPRAGLVGEWKMDGNAQAATGQSGVVNGVTAGLSRKGQSGGALEFTPGSEKKSNVILGYTPLGTGAAGDYTVSLWVKFKTLQKAFLFAHTNGVGHNANIRIENGKIYHEVYPGAPGGASISQSSMTQDSWYHLSFVWSSSIVSIYINGILDTTSATARNYAGDPATHVALGQNARSDGTYLDPYWDLNGFLDDLRIYNRALSAAEILALSKE